ncbi:hypothetical protein K458DRAFT_422323 [Lentithecium fluviatile CBS 122367]|uniref:EthD domain-containing protein n=1 Tax=Lentithecium fluviatile CBS 122367 TaxID=1168545 RepID=A0A6G1IMR8_9PLEO|nr:hypothetical protein K458DRAFT_422323 [Lentithecium fluviatile CBS 122367]
MSKSATVTVLYPRESNATFDLDYYLSTHMPLVYKHWNKFGLKTYKVTKFNDDAPYTYGVAMDWGSADGFGKALQQDDSTKEIMDDIENFSSVKPVIAAGKVVGTG